MSKAVLLSIKPKYCELIASCKKTVEVRKTRPKLATPFKVYIYETKGYDTIFGKDKPKKLCVSGGRVIGEFVCDEITGGFLIVPWGDFIQKQTCLTYREIYDYGKDKPLFYWHISDLVIYDKPKELGEFSTPCKMRERLCRICDYAVHGMDGDLIGCDTSITRPPQSWCYVESEVQE